MKVLVIQHYKRHLKTNQKYKRGNFYNISIFRVVISKNIITSRSPGTALEFAITLVEVLYGSQKAL
jgi:putative intracellular protease/amidase